MTKGSFYIVVEDKKHRYDKNYAKVERVHGYVFTDDESGLQFGCDKRDNSWAVTELSTGLLVSNFGEAKVKNDAYAVVDKKRKALVKVINSKDKEWAKNLINEALSIGKDEVSG